MIDYDTWLKRCALAVQERTEGGIPWDACTFHVSFIDGESSWSIRAEVPNKDKRKRPEQWSGVGDSPEEAMRDMVRKWRACQGG